jgi:CubicO group peptidase (beta-lactamase class C family)
MAKGITDLLVGRLAGCGWMKPTDHDLMPQWRERQGDPRAAITVDQLLRMTSGLQWTETYDGSPSDLMLSLTDAVDAGDYAAEKPLKVGIGPGQSWAYSGGSYEIVSRVMRRVLTQRHKAYAAFPYSQLFQKLGMTSAVLEASPDGTYLLSAFALATARDWARLGQFILSEAQGRESGLLPSGWIEQSVAVTKLPGNDASPRYGAAFWSNSLGAELPPDTFYLGGLQGQFLVIVPSKNLVVVRLGSTPEDGDWSIKPIMTGLLKVLPLSQAAARIPASSVPGLAVAHAGACG